MKGAKEGSQKEGVCWGKEAASSEEWGWVGEGGGRGAREGENLIKLGNWNFKARGIFAIIIIFFALLTFLFQKKKNKNPMDIYGT